MDHHQHSTGFCDIIEGVMDASVQSVDGFVYDDAKVWPETIQSHLSLDISCEVVLHLRDVEGETIPIRPYEMDIEMFPRTRIMQIHTIDYSNPR